MLARVDKGLAILCWIAVAVLAVMLIAGPSVVAHDSDKAATKAAAGASPYAATATTATPDGKGLFKSNCGSCHTLSAAGTTGTVGPKLDGIGLNAAAIEAVMKAGPGVMPSFTSSLSPAERQAVASFVASQ
jgi:cytochrome c6